MELFALFGASQYDGEVFLGVYSSRDLARVAEAAYVASDEEDWEFYAVCQVVLDAAAETHF